MKQLSLSGQTLRVVLLMVMAFMSTVASAQVLLASDAHAPQSHGWAVYRNVHNEIILVHIPPRNQMGNGQGAIAPAAPGEVHGVRSLNKFPEGLAAINDRVYMVFPQTYTSKNERLLRRVYSGRARPMPIGDSWGFTPTDRLDSLPSIESSGELVEFIATTQNLWAMFKQDDGMYTLLMLNGSAWMEVQLPVTSKGAQSKWSVVGDGARLVAIECSDPNEMKPYVWSEDGVWDELGWPSVELGDSEFQFLAGKHGLLIIDSIIDEGTRIRLWSKDGVFILATGLDVSEGTALTVLGAVNRLLGISKSVFQITAPDETEPAVEIEEIDLADGAVLYSGAPFVAAPVSASELRFILGMMILVMIGILVLVILPEKPDAISIPDGFELADPGRRFTASLIDLFVIATLIGKFFGVRVIEIITLNVVAQSENSWLVIPLVIVTGLVSMSLFEWLFGATPGKFLVGLRVVRGQAGESKRISLINALVRNVAKWLLPPVAALALVDPEMLHRGDRVTRTLVVSAVPADKPKPDSSED